ncbi:MAG: hypothetical protein ACLR1F_07325 [Enterococcus avium]
MLYYYFCTAFTLISAAVSFGFSIDACLKARNQNEITSVNAKYALSRSLSLLIVGLGLLFFKEPSFLITISMVMIGVQLFDGIIGLKISTFKTIGPLLTALGNTIVLILFLYNH